MQIFISHINEESPLAKVLKEWIETTFIGQINVFVSSDSSDIPIGSKWLNKIEDALENSKMLIILCSQVSISRPWINFEAGCCWIKKIPIIPVCHLGINISNLPIPLSEFQAIDLKNPEFPSKFIHAIAREFAIFKPPRISYDDMLKDITIAINKIKYNKPVEPKKLDIIPNVIDENDAITIIQSWMGQQSYSDNLSAIYYDKVDSELHLPSGTTKKYIEIAAKRFNYIVDRKGKDTILFKDSPENDSSPP